MSQRARSSRGERGATSRGARASGAGSTFPTLDRVNRSGHSVGDICFACECRILEIGGPEGIVLAWCDCAWPEDHAEMELM